MEIGMTILTTLTAPAQVAKQDAWMSCILASLIGLFVTFLAVKLSLLYPNQSMIEYSQAILGRWLGKIVVLPYFVMWLSVLPIILRQSAEFVHLVLFNRTPLVVLVVLMLILVVYNTYLGGIESIARCSEIFGPLVFVAVAGTLFLSLFHAHVINLLPVYADSGSFAIIKAAAQPASFLGESIMLTMLTWLTREPRWTLAPALWGVGLAAFLVTSAMGLTLATFGPAITANFPFPYFGPLHLRYGVHTEYRRLRRDDLDLEHLHQIVSLPVHLLLWHLAVVGAKTLAPPNLGDCAHEPRGGHVPPEF